MTTIAHKPDPEAELTWFRDLLETLEKGDIESVRRAIVAAIKVKQREVRDGSRVRKMR